MFKKEIATAEELDLRPLGKVIIFRDKLTGVSNLPFRWQRNIIVISYLVGKVQIATADGAAGQNLDNTCL